MKRLAALALLVLTAPAQAKTIAYAIAIGNNAPPTDVAGLQSLRYADDDAVRYYQLFERLSANARLLAVLDPETQRRYPGLAQSTKPPTTENLFQAVDEIARRMSADRARGDDPVFYFAFSGHGVQPERGSAYLALTDGQLTQAMLRDRVLAKLPSRYSHLIIDACHAGAIVGVRGGSGMFAHEVSARTVDVSAGDAAAILDEKSLLGVPTVGVILATTAGQEAHEWSRYQSGVFTHEVISGLLGGADVNGDLKIEYTELQAFVAAANRSVADPRAIPRVIARAPKVDQNAAIVSLGEIRGATQLHGRAATLGAFHIDLENGQRYLDAHLGGEMLATLVLPTGAHAFLQNDVNEVELALDGRPIDLERLKMEPRRTATRGAIDAAYRTGLFASEFTTNYYKGFVDSIGAVGVSFAAPDRDAELTRAPSVQPRRRAAIALFVTGGVLALTMTSTAVLAAQAKSDFDHTSIQRAAVEASDRYTGYTAAAVTTGILAAAATITGAILWPKHKTRVLSMGAGGAIAGSW